MTYVDENGEFAISSAVISAGVGAVISGGAQIVRNLSSGNKWNQGVVRALAAGGISGLVSTITIAKLGTALSAVIMGGLGNTASDVIKGNISFGWRTVSGFIWGAPKSLQMVTEAMKLKDAYSLEAKL